MLAAAQAGYAATPGGANENAGLGDKNTVENAIARPRAAEMRDQDRVRLALDRNLPRAQYSVSDSERQIPNSPGLATTDNPAHYYLLNELTQALQQANRAGDAQVPEKAPQAPRAIAEPPEPVSAGRVANDFVNAGRIALDTNWLRLGAVATGTVLASSALDKRAFRFAKDHQNSSVIRNESKIGNALPWIGLLGSGLVMLTGGPSGSSTGFASVEAGTSALLLSTGLKYAFGRARPEDGLGTHNFKPFSSDNNNSSFPSRHAAVAWAVATPFAMEYDKPWLYLLPALTTLGRVGNREHWVSDAVAGSLLGYGAGLLFWEASRSNSRNAPRVAVSHNGIKLTWNTE